MNSQVAHLSSGMERVIVDLKTCSRAFQLLPANVGCAISVSLLVPPLNFYVLFSDQQITSLLQSVTKLWFASEYFCQRL